MKRHSTIKLTTTGLTLGIAISLLSACGGGSSSIVSTGGDGGIIGTAKVPKVTALTPVEAKSQTGETQTAVVNSNGKFDLDTTKGETYLLRTHTNKSSKNILLAGKPTSNYFYSIAHSDGKNQITRNIHPYTNLIVRNWFATHSLDIDNEFEKAGPITSLPSLAEINAIETEIEGIVSKLLVEYEVTGGIDLLATPFDINGQGFDKFLDRNTVTIENDLVTIVFTQNNGNGQGVSVKELPLSTDFTSNNDTPPTTPSGLTATVLNSSKVSLQWNASTDDKGVSGYNIFRNGNKVSTSPFPSFSDTGLSTNTNYTYRVQAIDSRDQLSNQSPATDPIVLTDSNSDPLDGTYNVVVTANTPSSQCGGATGSYTLSNGTELSGSVSNGTNVFVVNGTRNTNSGAVTGGYAFTSGQQFATFTGTINSNTSNGTYQDVNGCSGTWNAVKAN